MAGIVGAGNFLKHQGGPLEHNIDHGREILTNVPNILSFALAPLRIHRILH